VKSCLQNLSLCPLTVLVVDLPVAGSSSSLVFPYGLILLKRDLLRCLSLLVPSLLYSLRWTIPALSPLSFLPPPPNTFSFVIDDDYGNPACPPKISKGPMGKCSGEPSIFPRLGSTFIYGVFPAPHPTFLRPLTEQSRGVKVGDYLLLFQAP